MRLINTDSYKLENFNNERRLPLYAILSHRWVSDEVLFADITSGDPQTKRGYQKFVAFCQRARVDGYKYLWIDTCCIDKSSSAELSEAINSMYRWYRRASVCYAYLFDFDENLLGVEFNSICDSKWFTRSWTLQELIAPERLIFFDCDFQMVSTKQESLKDISQSTGIPESVLACREDPSKCSAAKVMQWAAGREATRDEDIAYSLLGLFDVNMSMLYGEGMKAFTRLQEEILKTKHDHSLFLCKVAGNGEMFASSPSSFLIPETPEPMSDWILPQPYSMTNLGVSIHLDVIPWDMHIYVARLEGLMYADRKYPFIFLRQIEHSSCERIKISGLDILKGSYQNFESGRRHLHVGSSSRLSRFQDPIYFGFEVCLRENRGRNERFVAPSHINFIESSVCDANPQLIKFLPRDRGRTFEVRWSDGRITTIRLRFDLDFKPVCLIKHSSYGAAMSNPDSMRIRSNGDDVSRKTFSDVTGFESLGWSMSGQTSVYPTTDEFWPIKGPVEATSLCLNPANPVGLSVELILRKPQRNESGSVWSFTLINKIVVQ